ncbi:short-chain dehydrogenase [Paucisalibacillus sp. EB02]|uniref:short-chain dehydrogenase n=1 Tax=Paucisalibacillus sp. EB02 TaxID=1347087 RepID=UPI0012DD0E54|nr:short-chain dehydrogenase [Paucisalibacillus sp. EB02]
MNCNHALVFGGTGMLAEATGWIVKHVNHTVVFGRNRHRLERLSNKYSEQGLKVQELDYSNTESLKHQITNAYEEHGEIDLVVAWIHSTAPDAIPTIKRQIATLQVHRQWTLVIVKGSSSHLTNIAFTENDVPENCIVKEVQLGFIYNEMTSRWLSHHEISEGVITGIQSNERKTVVGTLEPWDKRP